MSETQTWTPQFRIEQLEREVEALKQERDSYKEAFTQAEKEAIKALWDDDPHIPYVAGGGGPGKVIEHFKTERDAAQTKHANLVAAWNKLRSMLSGIHKTHPGYSREFYEIEKESIDRIQKIFDDNKSLSEASRESTK